MSARFTVLDAIVLLSYLVGTTTLGIWVGRKQADARDYFVADRAIPWWAVMFSIVATETSALTFISIPGVAYLGNLGFLQVATGYLLGRIVVAYTLLPRYYHGELVTAYALLERRFGRLSDVERTRIADADVDKLDAWLDRVLDAGSTADVLGD